MSAARWLANPAAVIAVAGLAVNDHVLKYTFGNWITGKISDVTGVFLLPLILLWAVEASRRLARRSHLAESGIRLFGLGAIAVTGVGFTITKLNNQTAALYGDAVGALRYGASWLAAPWGVEPHLTRVDVVTDATDILVLPVLFLSWLLIRGEARRSQPGEDSGAPALPKRLMVSDNASRSQASVLMVESGAPPVRALERGGTT